MRTICTDIMMICKECGFEPWRHIMREKNKIIKINKLFRDFEKLGLK